MGEMMTHGGGMAAGGDLLQVLQSQKVLTAEQADQVRRRMRRSQCTAAQAIFDLGFASQEIVYRALSQVTGLPFVILGETEISETATQRVPAKVALRFQFVPLSLERGTMRAAFAGAPTMQERDQLRLVLGVRLDPVLATPKEIDVTLKRVYGLGAGQAGALFLGGSLLAARGIIRWQKASGRYCSSASAV